MKIGIIGAGNVGTAIGKLLTAKGHRVFVSFAKTPDEIAKAAAAIGGTAQSGSVADAVAFGDVVVLATPYAATPAALKQAGDAKTRRIVWDCTNALKPDYSGLAVGFNTSAGEEVQKLAPWARVVKAIPPSAELMRSARRLLGGNKVTVFLCSDDAEAKKTVESLVREIDADPIDAGPLQSARYAEPAGYMIVKLYMMGMGGRIGIGLLRETSK